jgi:sodium-dependent phosphate cotransporter
MERLTQALPKGGLWKFVGLLLALILFFTSLELLGEAFELMGEDAAAGLLAATRNPITGFFTGILATTVVQSSSTTTSLTVALVAAGTIGPAAAIPVMLGANIGTSVTNTIVALGHFRVREEFQRAFTGALVLDLFKCWIYSILLRLRSFCYWRSFSTSSLGQLHS